MSLLERIIEKSGTPITREGLEEFAQLYGAAVRIVTATNDEGRLAGMAVLSLPIRLFGKNVCQALVFGTDGTVSGNVLIEKMKATAKTLGADRIVGATHRKAARGPHADALARRYGAEIDSVNLVWDL